MEYIHLVMYVNRKTAQIIDGIYDTANSQDDNYMVKHPTRIRKCLVQ